MIPTTADEFLKKCKADPRIVRALLVEGELKNKRTPLTTELQEGEHLGSVGLVLVVAGLGNRVSGHTLQVPGNGIQGDG